MDAVAQLAELTASAVSHSYLAESERLRLLDHCINSVEPPAEAALKLLDTILLHCPVVLHGLVGAPELNGQAARVCGAFLSERGRYPVEMVDSAEGATAGKPKRLVRLANLMLEPPAVPAGYRPLFTPSDKDDVAYCHPESSEQAAAAAADADEKGCRICMADEAELADAGDGPLIQPCACRGSASFACMPCMGRAGASSWEAGNEQPMRCKQCLQEYRPDVRLAIAEAKCALVRQRIASAATEEMLEPERRRAIQLWGTHLKWARHEVACVALVEYGRWCGHASSIGMQTLRRAETEIHELIASSASAEAEGGRTSYTVEVGLISVLGEVYRYQRRLAEAERHHRHSLLLAQYYQAAPRLLAAQLQDHGEDDILRNYEEDAISHLANGLVSQSVEHSARGRRSRAAECLREAELLLRRSLEYSIALGGETTRRARDSLARCLGKHEEQAKLVEAEQLARGLWRERTTEWGRTHQDTVAAQQFVAYLRVRQSQAAFRMGVLALADAADAASVAMEEEE